MRELTGNFAKFQCRDTDGYILTDIWKGEIPLHIGTLWMNYFHEHNNKVKKK